MGGVLRSRRRGDLRDRQIQARDQAPTGALRWRAEPAPKPAHRIPRQIHRKGLLPHLRKRSCTTQLRSLPRPRGQRRDHKTIQRHHGASRRGSRQQKGETNMNWSYIISIVLGVLAAVASFVGYYFYIRSKLAKAATGAVNDAEKEDKTGAEKLQIAVDQVYALVPAILKTIISREIVQGLVQAAFDKIEEYAKKQLEKKADKTTTE